MWEILEQAYTDTRKSLGWSLGNVIRTLLVAAGTIYIYFAFFEQEKAISEVIDWGIPVAASIFFVLVPTFLWNLWLAPYRLMEKRLDSEINGIKTSMEFVPSDDIKEPDKVDVSYYQNHENLSLYEAACLWVGIEPHHPIRDQKARAKLSHLKGAIRSHKLNCEWGNTFTRFVDNVNGSQARTPSDNQQVSMVNLRQYAEMIDDIPLFLWNIKLPPESSRNGEDSVQSTSSISDESDS